MRHDLNAFRAFFLYMVVFFGIVGCASPMNFDEPLGILRGSYSLVSVASLQPEGQYEIINAPAVKGEAVFTDTSIQRTIIRGDTAENVAEALNIGGILKAPEGTPGLRNPRSEVLWVLDTGDKGLNIGAAYNGYIIVILDDCTVELCTYDGNGYGVWDTVEIYRKDGSNTDKMACDFPGN